MYTVGPVAAAPNGASFTNATVQMNDGTSYTFYNTAGSVFKLAGTDQNGVIMYHNQEDLMQFPMSYNSQFSDPWGANYTFGGNPASRNGNSDVHYDGYGTLITPSGTYTNAARVSVLQNISDVAQFGTITRTVTAQLWYVYSIRYPVAGIVNLASSQTSPISSAWYRSVAPPNTVGLTQGQLSSNSLVVYPNPASGDLSITLNSNEAHHVELYDSRGSLLHSEPATPLKPQVKWMSAVLLRGSILYVLIP